MKFVITILLIALLAFISGIYLPDWGVALAAFLVSALIPQRPWVAFLSGFTAVFLVWGVMAYMIDTANGSILSVRIAQLLGLHGSSILLILVTALTGALIGGCASLTGSYLHKKKV